jgi:hypothetical protein
VTVLFINPGLDGTTGLSNVHLSILAGDGIYDTPDAFSPRSSFTGWWKLATFLGGRPTVLMLCLDTPCRFG